MNNNLNTWSTAHTFYSLYSSFCIKDNEEECSIEQKQRLDLIEGSINRDLFEENAFFKNLRTSKKQYLAHITYGLDKILESGMLFSSGGCLVGSVYCVPLTLEDKKLRMHNLGDYIFHTEAKILGEKKGTPEVLIIEVDTEEAQNNIIGIDYLKLGSIHKNIFESLEYLLSTRERDEIHSHIVRQVKESMDFLDLCSNIFYGEFKIDPERFVNCFRQTALNLPILGYLYFEVVSEYVMFFQDNDESRKYKDVGEFYSKSYKDLMYALQPGFKSNFKLSEFYPTINQIAEYLIQHKIFSHFDKKHFIEYLSHRLLALTMARLIPHTKGLQWRNFEWDFDNLAENADRLVGHLVHRELRNFGRYPSLYYYFDQTKALQAWNYWNHMDVIIPFNGILPKGEVGINPAYPNLRYKIYLGQVCKNNGFTYLDKAKQLKVLIEPRLVDLRYTTMRNKSDHVNLKT